MFDFVVIAADSVFGCAVMIVDTVVDCVWLLLVMCLAVLV